MLCFSVSPNVHFLLLKEAVPESCALVVHYLQTVHSSPRTELAAPKVCMTSINNMGEEGRGGRNMYQGKLSSILRSHLSFWLLVSLVSHQHDHRRLLSKGSLHLYTHHHSIHNHIHNMYIHLFSIGFFVTMHASILDSKTSKNSMAYQCYNWGD